MYVCVIVCMFLNKYRIEENSRPLNGQTLIYCPFVTVVLQTGRTVTPGTLRPGRETSLSGDTFLFLLSNTSISILLQLLWLC